jgi:hypothetical protein
MSDPTIAAQIEALDALKWANSMLHSLGKTNGFSLGMCRTLDASIKREADARANLPAIVTALRQAEAAPGVVEALEWAMAEIEGRTRYDTEDQRSNCLDLARDALSGAATADSGDEAQGWVIASACGEKFHTWRNGSPDWTTNPYLAVRYARRWDAERVHEEDEDAWRVVHFATLALARQHGAREDAPTQAMIEAGVAAWHDAEPKMLLDDLVSHVFSTMIAAAPATDAEA